MLKNLIKQPITFFTISLVLTLLDLMFLGIFVSVLGPGYWLFFFLHALVMLFMSGYFLGVDLTEQKYKELCADILDQIPEEEAEDESHI